MKTPSRQEAFDELKKNIAGCKRCRLHLSRTHALRGEGNLHPRLMLIAQAPGDKEDREGKMFIGPSGKVLNELLTEAGISRDEVYMTNLIKCRLPKDRRPKQDEIQACSLFLAREIALVTPQFLVPLGYYATRYVLETNEIPVPGARSEFSNLYGRLFLGKEAKIYPLPHPASLLYNKSFRAATFHKYGKLKVLSHPCKWHSLCPLKRFCENGRLETYWRELYCQGDWESCIRYQMEERGEYHPDWMLPDGTLAERLKP